MKKTTFGHAATLKPRLRTAYPDSEPAGLVCAGLALAVITLALRIMSIW